MNDVPPLTGPRLARDLAAGRAHAVAHRRDVRHAQREVAERGADLVVGDAVVVGQLDLGRAHLAVAVVGAVAEEGERVLLLGPIGGAAQLHAEVARVEVDRALQVADAQHRVEEFHGVSPGWEGDGATLANIAAPSAAGSLTSRRSSYARCASG
jgi:hypothetical protein